jgi:hypothetical protein
MMRSLRLLFTLMPALLLATACVQSTTGVQSVTGVQSTAGDIAYCNRLADLYERYIGRFDGAPSRPNLGGSLDADVAAAQCRRGDPSGIPALERVLRGNGFTLPPRG